MPKWLIENPRFGKKIQEQQFHFAVTIVTIIAYFITLFLSLYSNSLILKNIYYGFIGSMIINAFIPHFAATVYYKKYNPGVLTGILLNLPVFSYKVAIALSNNIIYVKQFFVFTLLISIVMLAIINGLFIVAKRIFKMK